MIKQAVPLTESVSKVDTDIQDPSTLDRPLILVGGSCANSLVQKLVDGGKLDAKYTCEGGVPGEGWETGKGYIWFIEDAFATGVHALVVAGTEKEQTRIACSALQQYETKLKDITTTSAVVTGTVAAPVVTAL
jgi:S-layer protein (TIGR01564 family)